MAGGYGVGGGRVVWVKFGGLVCEHVISIPQVLDREAQMDNPCGWLEDVYWDNITELDKYVHVCVCKLDR